jgi:PAS domain S-box-containing protein
MRDLYLSLLENSTDFIAIFGLTGDILYVNEAGRRLFDLGTLENARMTPALALFHPEDSTHIAKVITPELQRSGRWSGELRLRNIRTGQPIQVFSNVYYIRDPNSEKPIAIASVSPDLRARRRIENRMQILVEAGAALSASLDSAVTLQNVARLVVQSFATSCFVDVITSNGIIERLAIAHRDPSLQAYSKNVRRMLSAEDDPDHPTVRAIATGGSTIIPLIDEAWILASTNSEERAQHLRALQMRSLMVVPMRGPDQRIIGALTCGISTGYDTPSFDADDLHFAEELARRAGVAIENARRYERERRIAVSLQEASLPRTMPQTAYLLLDAEYHPGKTEATIGGDWYDAFVLRDGRIVLTIGDVLGSGLPAAVTMTKLRQAMQSAAMVRSDPNTMLDVADETLRLHDPDGYATGIAAIYDPSSHALLFAAAGHPGPALRTPDGQIEELISHGMMLGLRSGLDREVVRVATPPGSTLVFYTDGLIEATRDIDEGHRRLCRALSSAEVINASRPARALVEQVLAGEPPTDDIAVLIATIR